MTNVIKDSHGYYHYIGISKKFNYIHRSLMLDSNVAINIEKFCFAPNKMNSVHRNATLEFLKNNYEIDFVPGLGISEACWDINLIQENPDKVAKMELAFESIYKIEKSRLKEHANGSGINYYKSFKVDKVPVTNTLVNQLINNPNMLLSGTYAAVLKIMILQIKEKNKKKAIEEYLRFVNEDLKANLAIETNIAINYFLGTPEMQVPADKIFKFGKYNPLLNAWNTTWDLNYLRFFQKMYYESEHYQLSDLKLVTADEGLVILAKMTSLEAAINDGDDFIPILCFYDNDIRDEYIDFVKEIEKNLFDTVSQRSIKRNKEKLNIIELISVLEIELLKLSNVE